MMHLDVACDGFDDMTGVPIGGYLQKNGFMILDEMKKASWTTNSQNIREDSKTIFC